MTLSDDKIRLRALEPDDVDTLYCWENDPQVWGVSNTQQPFSRHILRQFIDNQLQDIYETKQTRFMIETVADQVVVGAIDIFDFDPFNARAGVGILIYNSFDRGKGYASRAINLLCDYAVTALAIHQLYCSIPADNIGSVALFEQCGFSYCGTRTEWIRNEKGWVDELLYQKIIDK